MKAFLISLSFAALAAPVWALVDGAKPLADGAKPSAVVDGQTLDQLRATLPDLDKDTFLAADTNGDGVLSEAELDAARARGLIPV